MVIGARIKTVVLVVALGAAASAGAAAWATDAPPLRGVIRAVNEAVITSDLAMRVINLPFREGEAFKMNDTLVEFDCERLRADLRAAEAERRGNRASWSSSARLYQMGAAGAHEVAVAAASHDKAAAVVDGLAARVKNCKITAPFNGRVVELNIHKYETPSVNQPLIKFLDDSKLEIDMLLPATSLRDLKVGQTFTIVLDENGRRLQGEVTRIGAALDIVSQTFKAAGVPKGDSSGVLPGMSGAIVFDKEAM